MKKVRMNILNKLKIQSHAKYQSDGSLIDISQKQFFKQQGEISELQKHLRTFDREIMNITEITDNMYTCFKSIYEPKWVGNSEFNQLCQESIMVCQQFIENYKNNISKAVCEYEREFPIMKKCIEKCNKKGQELSRQKKSYHNYGKNKFNKNDEFKLKKMEIEIKELEEECMNSDNSLRENLPKLCDKRISVYVELWTKMFEAEEAMFSSLQKNRQNQIKVLSKLASMAYSDEYSIRSQVRLPNGAETNILSTKPYTQSAMSLNTSFHTSNQSANGDRHSFNEQEQNCPYDEIEDDQDSRSKSYQSPGVIQSLGVLATPENASVSPSTGNVNSHQKTFKPDSKPRIGSKEISNLSNIEKRPPPEIIESDGSDIDFGLDTVDGDMTIYAKIKKVNPKLTTNKRKSHNKKAKDRTKTIPLYDTIKEYHYQMEVQFKYTKEDDDELDLVVGDIIMVLPWENDENMEDDWLFGENINTKKRGIFPENHANRIYS